MRHVVGEESIAACNILTLFKLLMVAACMAMAVTMVTSQLCVRKIKTGFWFMFKNLRGYAAPRCQLLYRLHRPDGDGNK